MNAADGRQKPLSASIVYRFYDDEGQLLYVGCTQNVRRRFAEHFPPQTQRNDWRAEVARVETTPAYPNRRAAEEAEALAIFTEGPLFNSRDRGGSTAAYKRLFGSARIPDALPRIRDRIARRLGEDPGVWAYRRRQEPVRTPYVALAAEIKERTERYCTADQLAAWSAESGPDPWGEAVDLAWSLPDWTSGPSNEYAYTRGSWRLP